MGGCRGGAPLRYSGVKCRHTTVDCSVLWVSPACCARDWCGGCERKGAGAGRRGWGPHSCPY
eukprot:scaffold16212_cov112-Isochrysis_galbana.AAC.3